MPGQTRLQTFIRRVTANGTRAAWYLQLDIRNRFMSIDRQILFDLLTPRIRDASLMSSWMDWVWVCRGLAAVNRR